MSRDARVRIGHSLLGVFALGVIVLGAYGAVVGSYDPRDNDWTCAEIVSAPGTTCLDINMHGAGKQ